MEYIYFLNRWMGLLFMSRMIQYWSELIYISVLKTQWN